MNRPLIALVSRLTCGAKNTPNAEYSKGVVTILAKAYEKARNALEYRADNLVRRAAIERILKRLVLIYKDPSEVASHLLMELKWARYIDRNSVKDFKRNELANILIKYIEYTGSIPHDWIIKIASSEIEEYLNPNKDYNQFTFFAFQTIKQKVKLEDENLDLLVYFSVDKIYAASDPEKIAYHIISLGGNDIKKETLEEGWRLFNIAQRNKHIPRLNKFVRKVMPPLVLFRDIYFYSPTDFKAILANKDMFTNRAIEVLDTQLSQMSDKISTAGIRSIVYVLLTKMIFAFGLETPLETFIYGHISLVPLTINIIFPPVLMWISTMKISLPTEEQKNKLIQRTWYILDEFDSLNMEEDNLTDNTLDRNLNRGYLVFSALYALIFIGVFIVIYSLLGVIGFKLLSKLIFIFFLTIIAFFAYRINQIAHVYYWQDKQDINSLSDTISLPILTIGSILSQGLNKLNFLGFVFDFILEAPFKLILRFVDDWVQFISIKKEQQILD